MHDHFKTCHEEICLTSNLFNDGLSHGISVLNCHEEHLKKCSDFVIYLKKKLSSQIKRNCLENLTIFFIHQIKAYAEKTQYCQKFIQMIGLIHKIKPELTVKGLEIFFDDVEQIFSLEDKTCFQDSHELPKLRTFSMLLEGVNKFGDIVERKKTFLFTSLVSMVSTGLLKGVTILEKQTVYYIIKIILQLLQLKGKTNNNSIETTTEVYCKCLTISMAVLKADDCTKDSQLIAASVVVELLKLLSGHDGDDLNWLKMVYVCFHYLLRNLSLNEPSKATMGTTVLCGALLTHSDIKKLAITLEDLKFGDNKQGFELKTLGTESSQTDIFDFKIFFDFVAAENFEVLEVVSKKDLYSFIFELASSTCRSSSSSHLHYQSLKLLEQWCQLLSSFHNHRSIGPQIESTCVDLMGLITMHVDSQVDGVDKNSVELLDSMLGAFHKISTNDLEFQDQFELLKTNLFSRVMSFKWNIRSKYLLLGPLLDHVSADLALEDLMSDMRKCLSTNHLVPCSTNIYKKIVTNFKLNQNLCLWINHCCPHLINALTDSKSLERKNAAHYWLPHTLHIIPESLQSIIFCLNHLEILSTSTSSSSPVSSQIYNGVLERLNTDVCFSSVVYARLRILWAARMAALPFGYPLKDMQFAFSASSNDLRHAALNLICISPSTTDCPTEEDVLLLKQFMTFQLSVDDPAFRKELEKCLRSICVRCRDHALLQIRVLRKSKKGMPGGNDKNIRLCLELVDFLWHTCITNLSPNSNYQRLNSALTWMKIILGTFVSTPHQNVRKGIVPVDVHLLMEAAMEKSQCNFFNESCTISLMCCVFNDVEQISEMASEILQLFFPWPLKCESFIKSEEMLDGWKHKKRLNNVNGCVSNQHHTNDVTGLSVDVDMWLLRESFILCNNFRSRESSCGIMLGGLLFSRSILEQKTAIELFRSNNNIVISRKTIESSSHSNHGILSNGLSFMEQLFDLVVGDFEEAISDIVHKSSSRPLHGMLSLVTTCFKKIPLVESDGGEDTKQMRLLVKKIVDFCKNLVVSILDIFGGRLLSEATSPSFEQISCAISELIEASRRSKADGGQDGKVVQESSEEEVARLHQFITSWCWLNIKECGLLLGELMKYSQRNKYLIIAREETQSIGCIFFKVLTQCRHRGAIESCTLGFMNFCSSAFHSSDKFLFDLPANVVNQVFDQLEALSDSSTTRRSAGLPSIIQTVLISEIKCGQTIILRRTIEKLLQISSNKTPLKDFQEQRDHPQVHSMNILKTLVHESCLSDAMSQFLEEIILLVLDGFNSDNWMIRNAALQLFGSMVPRMLGEKTSSDDTTHSTNSSEFLVRFPKFFQSMLKILSRETQNMKNSLKNFVDFNEKFLKENSVNSFSRRELTTTCELITSCESITTCELITSCESITFSHSLVPILSLLSRLAPSYHLVKHMSSQELSLCYLVQNLCQSSMLMVRDLSAKVIVALVDRTSLFDILVSMVMLLPDGTNNSISTNHIHGLLLQLLKLHVTATDCLSDEQMSSMRSLLEAKTGLLFSTCLLIRACYLRVMTCWHPQYKLLTEDLEGILTTVDDHEIGSALYQQTLTNIWLSESHDQHLLTNHIASCLKSSSSEIVLSCLEWILNFEISMEDNSEVAIILWNLLENFSKLTWQILCAVLKTLIMLSRSDVVMLNSFNQKWNLLKSICGFSIDVEDDEESNNKESALNYTPSRLALELLSTIFKHVLVNELLSENETRERILEWSGMILWRSRCTRNVDLRGSVVEACKDVVPVCFKIFTEHRHLDGDWNVIFVRLLETGLTFLTDGDADIRASAAEIISLVGAQESAVTLLPSSIHHEIAMEMWLKIILNLTNANHSVIQFLYELVEENKTFQMLTSFHKNMFELDEIFQAEDDNPYFEADQFHRIISTCLLKLNLLVSYEFVEQKVQCLGLKVDMVTKIISTSNRSLELVFNRKLSTCLSSLCWQHLLSKNILANLGAQEVFESANSYIVDLERKIEFLMQLVSPEKSLTTIMED